MFEYWVYIDAEEDVISILGDEIFEEECKGYREANGDCIWYFQATNIFVIQSEFPFGDGNIILDKLLIKLAKKYQIHDKGIIKSHWKTSSFH